MESGKIISGVGGDDLRKIRQMPEKITDSRPAKTSTSSLDFIHCFPTIPQLNAMRAFPFKTSVFTSVFIWLAIFSVHAQQWVRWEPTNGGNGHWYKAVVNTNGLTWTQTAQLAIAEGGYLATITSAAENDFVFSLVNSPEFFQGNGNNGSGPALGGFQPAGSEEPAGGWSWITGEPWSDAFSSTNWYGGSPDDGLGFGEDRLQYFSGTQGVPAQFWNDLPSDASNLGGYIIESNQRPTTQPVRSGFYGQSLLSPAGPTQSALSVYDANNKLVRRLNSNPAGQFFSYLAAGQYTLVATLPKAEKPPQDLSQYDPQQHPEAVVVQFSVNPRLLTAVPINF